MRSRSRSARRLAAAVSLLVAACSVDVQVPQGAKVTCGGDGDCPSGFRCNGSTGQCVPANTSDLTAPVVLSVSATPSVSGLAAGGFDRVDLALVTDEPLAGAPRVFFRDGVTERAFGALTLAPTQPATGRAYQASYTPTGAETQGAFGLQAVLEDAVGNRFEGPLPATVAFDFVAPALVTTPAEVAPDVVLLPDPVANPLAREVAQVTRVANRTTRVLVSFTVSEDVATPVLHTTPATGLAFQLFGRAGNTWTFEVDWAATTGALGGGYALVASLEDGAGNAAEVPLTGADLALDTEAPAVPSVNTPRALRLVRAPWGGEDGVAGLFLEGEAGAVEPDAWVLAYSDAAATRELGRTPASATGAFGGPGGTARFALASGDLDRVYVRVADAGGNLSGGGAATLVRDVLWRASLGGKAAGDPLSNPHRAVTTPWLAPFLDQRFSAELGGAGIGKVDGATAALAGGGSWWELEPRVATPGGRSQLGMAFDPVRGTTYLAGGYVGFSNGGQPATCTNSAYSNSFPFLARSVEPGWHAPPESGFSQPPAPGAIRLVFDGTRDVLLAVGNGQARWDGTAWIRECQDGCGAPVPFATQTAVYWDPVVRRVVRLLATGFDPIRSWAWDGAAWTETCTDAACAATRPEGLVAAAAFDDGLAEGVAFGLGADRRQTWSFDGTRWTERCTDAACQASRPPGRIRAALAYDRARAELVLFGGDVPENRCSGALIQFGVPNGAPPPDPALQDTWVFSGGRWTARAPATKPPPRYDHAMVWDAVRGRVVLQGGTFCDCYAYNHPATYGDVWEWDGAGWSQPPSVAVPSGWFSGTTPPGSSFHSLALDPSAGRVVMRGGALGADLYGFMNGQWWQRPGAGAAGRWEVPMASPTPYGAPSPQGPALFSGAIDASYTTVDPNAYVLGSTGWTPACGADPCVATAPPARYLHAWASDGGGLVLFGGSSWVPNPVGGGPPTGGPGTAAFRDTWRLVPPAGWTRLCNTSPCSDTLPPARAGHAMAYAGAAGDVLLFGGAQGLSSALGDTWLWSGNRWAQLTTAESPPARTGHTLVRDPSREVVVLYGGTDDPGSDYTGDFVNGFFVDATVHAIPAAYEDVWEWKAGAWRAVPSLAPRSGDTSPGRRYAHGADWEPQSGGMLVHGGSEPPATHLWSVNAPGRAGSAGTWLWRPEPEGRPALLARVNLGGLGPAARPLVQAVEARWVGSASGKVAAASSAEPIFRMWDGGGWAEFSGAACGAGCFGLDTSTGAQAVASRATARYLAGSEVIFAVLPKGTNGTGLDRATLSTDYLAVGLWYRWP